MPVARLRLRITSTWVGSDNERAARSLSVAQSSSSQRGFMLPSLRGHGRIRMWHKAAFIMAPALFTLSKHLIGVAAGMVALGVVTGAAILPWAGLAFTAASNAEDMGRAGTRYAQGLDRVKSAWMTLARDTASLTLGPVVDVLNGVAAAIPKLEPLVREVAPDFARMGRDIGAWLSGAGFDRFLQNIRDYGVPAFRELVDAGVDFLATMGIGFRHFLPMARQISEELRQLAGAGLDTARGGGFARWIRDWRENAPRANRVLRETATALGTFFQLLDDVGPGLLGGLDMFLGLINSVDPKLLTAMILGWAAGKFIAGLALMLLAWRTLRALRAVGFIAMGVNLNAAAAALTAAGGVINSMAVAIGQLAKMVVAMTRFRVNSSALDRIKEIWDSVPKNARATLNLSSLNLMIVAMMGLNSTWVTVQTNLARVATFGMRIDAGLLNAVGATILLAWAAVYASAITTPVFTAAALNLAAMGMTALIANWARVRAASAVPVVFTATASPGNVSAVASSIIAAWARVRAAAAVRPFFTATAINTVSAGAAIIVSAWMRVVGMPKIFTAVGIVSPGNVPGASSAIRASWMALYGMGRSWHGVARCSFSGGFGGISGGSVTIGGGGGGDDWYNPTDLFVVHQPLPFTGRPYNPYAGLPGGGLMNTNPNVGPVGPGNLQGGQIGPPNPGDFAGGFGGYTGGQLTAEGFDPGKGKGPRGKRGDRHIHIYDDIWVEDHYQLMEVMEEAMGR